MSSPLTRECFHDGPRGGDYVLIFCRKTYIRTDHAWYILDNPAEVYIPYFAEFAVHQRVFDELISSARADKGLTLDDFAKELAELEDAEPAVKEADLQDPALVSTISCD